MKNKSFLCSGGPIDTNTIMQTSKDKGWSDA